ncbi:putative S-adenosylmethionine carrier 2, chloroplastic [Porphyridium purpureum]|uniref:Putative S-adenosylmethionine carrier 2, chloroplastic n=1 Tax=Porphyridium purpureum TaxID=35688 RepID=A0A5J4Z9G3_PORPP|nr:putative S-adenosylmethionine carrier 2, chloroplastic [Porphyridium purpureum]|eukprot:POR5076..scf295_1
MGKVVLCARASKREKDGSVKSAEAAEALEATELGASESFWQSLVSGAAAGIAVDMSLFPLDTIKTRLQTRTPPAELFKGVYAGIKPALIASAPGGAVFFGAYDISKRCASDVLGKLFPQGDWANVASVIGAIGGDLSSCVVRTPFETVKQLVQAGLYSSGRDAVRGVLAEQGIGGLYTGYLSLVARELPFDMMQFPIYEALKRQRSAYLARRGNKRALKTWESSLCGSCAGAISAAATTPFDVVKTRIMTGEASSVMQGFRVIVAEEGPQALFQGIVPRVLWISLGGAIFFGAYEAVKKTLEPVLVKRRRSSRRAKASARAVPTLPFTTHSPAPSRLPLATSFMCL